MQETGGSAYPEHVRGLLLRLQTQLPSGRIKGQGGMGMTASPRNLTAPQPHSLMAS